MPAIACCVDSTYTFSTWDTSLPTPPTAVTWSPSHSESLYRVNGWGAPYFSVNDNGNISVHPYGDNTLPHQEMDLLKVVKKATDPKSSGGLGLHLPLIVRFPDVLQNRLQNLQSSFDFAIHSTGYAAHYQGVYPVKCNQDKFVVEDIVRFGSGFRFGLEAGSKPELLLAMSCLCNGSAEGLLVCNGFKDAEYISLALVARKMHLNTVIVLEQEEELDIVIDVSKRLGVRPVIGLRAKLRTKHSGHFGSTSGEKGKFGLTTMQILNVVTKLREHEMLDCLQLLHFHIGSQIPTTVLLADGVSEAAQIYCELVRLGAGMKVIDIGGGLGIDYDGSKSQDSDISVAYTLQEYASAVVQTIRLVCDRKGVNHPVLCSESGRAIVSHHSILVFEAVSASSPNNSLQEITPLGIQYIVDRLTGDAFSEYGNLSAAAMRGEYDTCLLYTEQLKQKCAEQFKDGTIGLEQLAAVDGLCELVTKAMGGGSDPTRTYDVNLSVFTSIPDFWGIGQLFPIMPIHRLEEKPTTRAILSDLTCDSDGKIDKFIGGDSSLPLHELDSYGGPYYLGMFLGGAYQESLGGLHNLFGGPSVVRVSQSDGPHGFAVTSAVPGPSCGDVLRVMQFEPELMYQTLKHRIEEVEGDDSGGNNNSFIDGIACTFNSMPYLSPASSCSSLIAEAAGDTNNGYYYCSDVADSVASEEDQWSYCVT